MSETTLKENENIASENEKPYTFRRLSSADVFPMFKIISLIGIDKFKNCFDPSEINNMVDAFTGKNADSNIASYVGVTVALDIANVIFSNITNCESYIYQLLSQTSNLSLDEVKNLDFVVFTEMVIDFVKKEEFKDFIKVVSKLFK